MELAIGGEALFPEVTMGGELRGLSSHGTPHMAGQDVTLAPSLARLFLQPRALSLSLSLVRLIGELMVLYKSLPTTELTVHVP